MLLEMHWQRVGMRRWWWVLWPAQGILVLVYIARVEVLKLR